MAQPGDYLDSVTLADFVNAAFNQPEGGIFAGVGTTFARGDQAARQAARAAGQVSPESYARARLVPLAAGKVLARWCNSHTLGDFKAGAGGIWWSSDDVADGIVRRTIEKYGPDGDSGQIVRGYSAVKYEWGSDLGAVVVARTTRPIKIVVGFGRPVQTVEPGQTALTTLGNGTELQFMMMTKFNGVFRGNEFLDPLYVGNSRGITRWWASNNPAAQRRAATIAAAKAGPITGGGYPKGVVRVT